MKKFLSVLIALAIVFSMTVPAMATEESYGNMGNDYLYGEGEITVGCRAYSTFTLQIPLCADACSYNQISASNPNIEPGYRIEVRVTNLNEDGTLPVVHESTGCESAVIIYTSMDGAPLTYENPVLAAFAESDFDESGYAKVEFSIMHGRSDFDVDAGYYSGVICYRIECNPA